VRFKRKIAEIPLRILVEGTRGKSSTVTLLEEELRREGYRTLGKVTGSDPRFIWNGDSIDIIRENDVFPLLDYDNMPGILDFDCDALILENQAITPYTMRFIHKLIGPQHVVIPNIRIDHTEGLGKNLTEMAKNFVNNYHVGKNQKTVYYGETISSIRNQVAPVFRDFADKNPHLLKLLEIHPDARYYGLPSIENLYAVSLFMEHNFGHNLDIQNSIEKELNHFSVKTSSSSIRYLDLAKVNDPVSFLTVLKYVLKTTNQDIAVVAYFRKDRMGRNIIFENIFPELEKITGNRLQKIWFSGFGTGHSFGKLPPSLREKAEYNIKISDIEDIFTHLITNNLILVTMCNRVNPFMDDLVGRLELPENKFTSISAPKKPIGIKQPTQEIFFSP